MINQNWRQPKIQARFGFTLIELLVVISVIAILTALTIPVLGAIKRHQYIQHAQSELAFYGTAIDNYKAAFGFYPPSDPNNVMTPQLYYELTGVKIVGSNYVPLDGNTDGNIAVGNVQAAFGVGGFMNCTKGSGEEALQARTFLSALRATQYSYVTNNGVKAYILVTAVGGPNPNYQPLGGPANPWRYNSVNPTNNSGGFDLWVDLKIGTKLYEISNWTKEVPVSP
jgi:prepilin-type N-terminal cleavage/methylation domain-containing protein